ncbi:ATPase, T2SS/T4P/T4SS family, partial [bacterium]|nr:ATPase, T2SS/T4P/T4SS family [bacterium]MDB2447317.1 ATPase, T2SS/T4P/T4SS family [bacterium]
MERFKQALKAALSNSAAKISIVETSELEVISGDGNSVKLLQLPPADAAWMDTLIAFLFKEDIPAIDSGTPVQGSLNIPGVGLLKAIAHKKSSGKQINLYFPNSGDSLFDTDWTAITSSEGVAPADPAYGITGPGKGGEQEGTDESDNFSPGDMFSAPEDSEVDSAVAEATDETPGNMFSIPQEADSGEEVSEADSGDMFAPVSDESSSSNEIEEQSVGKSEGDLSSNMFAPVGDVPAAEAQPIQPVQPIQSAPQSHQPVQASPATGPQKKIIFGNTDPAKSIVRDKVFSIDAHLKQMISMGASDMHLTLGQPFIYRVDGDLQRHGDAPISDKQMEDLLLPIMPSVNQKEFSEIYDTDFAYEIPGVARFRVNMFKDNYGVGAVLRQIPAEVLTADQLKLPPAIRKFCHLHKGLVLVTGPTGSGKSTTLAAMIDLINKSRPDHIL